MTVSGRLPSLPMVDDREAGRDLPGLVVRLVGRLEESGDPWEPYRLVAVAVKPLPGTAHHLQADRAALDLLPERKIGHDR